MAYALTPYRLASLAAACASSTPTIAAYGADDHVPDGRGHGAARVPVAVAITLHPFGLRAALDNLDERTSACRRWTLQSRRSAHGQDRTDQAGTGKAGTLLANSHEPKATRSNCNRNCGVVLGQPARFPVEWATQHALFALQPAKTVRLPTARLVLRGRAQRTPG